MCQRWSWRHNELWSSGNQGPVNLVERFTKGVDDMVRQEQQRSSPRLGGNKFDGTIKVPDFPSSMGSGLLFFPSFGVVTCSESGCVRKNKNLQFNSAISGFNSTSLPRPENSPSTRSLNGENQRQATESNILRSHDARIFGQSIICGDCPPPSHQRRRDLERSDCTSHTS